MERMYHKQKHFKTISLFCGAGGLDLGFLNAGFDIIWANDIDKYAVESYKANIGENVFCKDLNQCLNDIPKHDILIGGFPCQPFSSIGKQKGFEDHRGTLFFTIQQILEKHNTKIIVLENVRNLLNHDNGMTFKKIKSILESKLDYTLYYKIINTADYGIPQTRRRLFIVGFNKKFFPDIEFNFPKEKKLTRIMKDMLDTKVESKYFLSEKTKNYVLSIGTKNFYSKPEIDLEIARPLTATMHKMHRAGVDNYITDKQNRLLFQSKEKEISNIRRLTPNECRKLQGFPNDWKQVVSDTQAYKQFGNAVTVDVAYYIAKAILDAKLKTNSLKGE